MSWMGPSGGILGALLANEILMRLTLIDRIVEIEAGKRILATKSLTLSEDYLRDHFPCFPVMPGVLMLEAMYQTAAWLARVTDNFQHSLVTMVEANNVKYSDFVEPGQTLHVTAELLKQDDRLLRFKCEGQLENNVAVRGRLVLRLANLAEQNPMDGPLDASIIHTLRSKFRLLCPNDTAGADG